MSDQLACALRIIREVQGAYSSLEQAEPLRTPGESGSEHHDRAARVGEGTTAASPTAFISWAHSHSSWSSDQARAWESQVAAFAFLVRRLGIDADVDLFHLDAQTDWTRYGPAQVQTAKHTLIVMSQGWAERWSGTNSPREGAGAAAEADTLKGLFARDQDAWQRGVAIVMFPDVDSSVVPPDLQRVVRVSVDPYDPDSYEHLLRLLTDQPRYPKPPLGVVPTLAAEADVSESSTLETLRDRLVEIASRRDVLATRTTRWAIQEREQLDVKEAATRGFIDAELTIED